MVFASLLLTALLLPPNLLGDVTPATLSTCLSGSTGVVLSEGSRPYLRVSNKPTKEARPWDSSMHVPVAVPIAAGDTILVRVRLRSLTGTRTSVHMEQASEPFAKFVSEAMLPPKQWKTYEMAGVANRAYAPNEAQLAVFFGYSPGTIDIADLTAESLGKTPISSLKIQRDWYGGLPNSDAWRVAAEKRIEKIRKGDLVVKVVDTRGKPIPSATVRIDQVRHRFRFGTAVPAFRLVSNNPDDVRFRKNLLRLFNTVVFENDLKWFTLEPRDYAQVDQAMAWLKANRFDVRGHNFVWGSRRNLPKGLWEKTDAEILTTMEKRVKETASRFKGQLYCWDVVNEAVSEKELWDRLGWEKFAQVYHWAREADPQTQLIYNDFDITEEAAGGNAHRLKAVGLIRYLINHGTPLDAIGIQAHVSVPMTPMARVLQIFDEMAQFKKPLEITEYDLGVWDDKVHARHMGDFLTASFSHPSVQSFLMWGFWAGSHWRANDGGAMINRDWSERSAVAAYEDLVKGKWWTHISTKADKAGSVRARAFFGTQRITVTVNGKSKEQTIELAPGKPKTVVVRM